VFGTGTGYHHLLQVQGVIFQQNKAFGGLATFHLNLDYLGFVADTGHNDGLFAQWQMGQFKVTAGISGRRQGGASDGQGHIR